MRINAMGAAGKEAFRAAGRTGIKQKKKLPAQESFRFLICSKNRIAAAVESIR